MTTLAAQSGARAGDRRPSDIRLERIYPHPRARVWRALTDPALVEAWLMRPEGFVPTVGQRFILRARKQPGWRGWVECVVREVETERCLAYSWVGDEGKPPTLVRWTLEDAEGGGTRLRLEHTGFAGFGGWILAKLMLGPGWRKMLERYVPLVLAGVQPDGSFSRDPRLPVKCD